MKRFAMLLAAFLFAVSAIAADTPKQCTMFVGAVSDLTAAPSETIPLLVEISPNDFAAAAQKVDALSPEQRKQTTVVVRYAIDEGKDPMLDVESKTSSIVDWARLHGPFDALAVVVENADPAVASYGVKRLAVMAQGLNAASRIAIGRMPLDDVKKLYEHGANAYFDAIIVDAANVTDTAAWLLANDPSKKIFAVVTAQSPNVLFDLAQALAQGATRAFCGGQAPAPVRTGEGACPPPALAAFNRAMVGDFAYDSTSQTAVWDIKGNKTSTPVLTFIRGEDLRALVVPKGDAAAATIVAIPS